MPIIGSFIGSLGWAIGISLSRYFLVSNEIPISESSQTLLLLVSLLVSIYSFALSYFACDYYFKIFLFPLVFEQDEIFNLSKFLKDGLIGKFSFYFFSAVMFPMLVIFFALNASIGNVSIEEDVIYFFLLVFIFIISGAILTYFLVQSLRRPLNEIQSLTDNVRTGDFTGAIFVDSKDELGTIKYTMNTMSRELLEKETIREIFGKMVDGRIRDYLLKHPPELGGKK
jgi:adenylate cyclase